MDFKLAIKIKKRNQPEFLIWFIILFPFTFGTVIDLFSVPNAYKYTLDLAWIFLLALLVINFGKISEMSKRKKFLLSWIFLFILATAVIYLFKYQSIFYYLWGFRNNFRFFVFFSACMLFLKREDISDYFKLFDILFWLNALVTIVQYFIFGYLGDRLGGLFGVEIGCNRYTNLFFIIITIKTIVYYLNKHENIWSLIAKSATMMMIAAMAEIKFFYVIFTLIIILAVLFTNFSVRKLVIIVGGIIAVFLGVLLLGVLFPNSYDFFSIEKMLEITASDKGYTSSGDLNRLTAIPIILKDFLNEPHEMMFGFGLGNCDLANYDFLSTPFYEQYGYLRYDWFSVAFAFIETGFLGLTFFFGFFILIFLFGRKKFYATAEEKIHSQIAVIMALCCIAIMFYNASLRSEAGYMAYFILALPFLKSRNKEVL